MIDIIKVIIDDIRTWWRMWRRSKASWRSTPSEVQKNKEARHLMLAACGGVSRPAIDIKPPSEERSTNGEQEKLRAESKQPHG